MSERAGLEIKPGAFVDVEHEVHVLHSLSAGALKQVVDDAGDKQLTFMLLHMDEALVGIDDLLEIQIAVNIMRESCRRVELLVELHDVLFRYGRIYTDYLGTEDAAGKVTTIWDEVHSSLETWLQLSQRLTYLRDVLMLERLVDAHVAHAP